MMEIGWKRRLAVVLSIFWLGIVLGLSSSSGDTLGVFLLIGALPVATLWGIAWVWSGFRKDRSAPDASGSPPPTTVPRASLLAWLGVVLIFCAGALLYYGLNETEALTAYNIGRVSVSYFLASIVAYFVWKSAFQSRKGCGVLIVGLAFLTVSGYESYSMLREQADAKRALAEAQNMMLRLNSGEQVDRSRISGFGQFTPLLLLIHDFLAPVQQDFLALEREIEAAELETIFTRRTLQDSAAIARARSRVMSLTRFLKDTESRVIASYELFPSSIDSADLPHGIKTNFREGVEESFATSKPLVAKFFRIQRVSLDETSSLLDFLQRLQRQGSYTFRGDQILFASQNDLDQYNRQIQKIQQLALQESEWQNTHTTFSAKQLREMSELLK